MTATAGASHAYTPVLVIVARKDEISPRQARWKTVALHDSKASAWA